MNYIKAGLVLIITGVIFFSCSEKKNGVEVVPDLDAIYLPASSSVHPVEKKGFKIKEEKDLIDAVVKSLKEKSFRDTVWVDIRLRLYINEKGAVDKIKDLGSYASTLPVKEMPGIFTPEGKNKLDDLLASKMSDWQYLPAIKNGKPVKSSLLYRKVVEMAPDGNIKMLHVNFMSDMPGDFNQVDKMPQIVKSVSPKYPELAKRQGLEGTAFIKVLVDTAGNPVNAIVIKSDNEIFNQPSIDAVMKFKFSYALKDNRPVDVWVVIPFKYKLGGGPEGKVMKNKEPKKK